MLLFSTSVHNPPGVTLSQSNSISYKENPHAAIIWILGTPYLYNQWTPSLITTTPTGTSTGGFEIDWGQSDPNGFDPLVGQGF